MGTSKSHRKRVGGRFSSEDVPPSKRVECYFQEPLLQRLLAYAEKHGLSKSQSVVQLLESALPAEPVEDLPSAEKRLVELVRVDAMDPIYHSFRESHYIPSRGTVGQQIHYVVLYDSEPVGGISGASAVFTTEARDQFFDLSSDKDVKTTQLNSIINNSFFRLEYPAKNLASIVLSKWRKQVAIDWKERYGTDAAGFETFIVEERLPDGRTRNGGCYRADNWELVGITKGYGDENIRGREHGSDVLMQKKLIYCKKIPGVELCSEYQTSWFDKDKRRRLEQEQKVLMENRLDLLLKTVRD